jgi:hypothetical protein
VNIILSRGQSRFEGTALMTRFVTIATRTMILFYFLSTREITVKTNSSLMGTSTTLRMLT